MIDHWVLDPNGVPVEADLMTWARWFETTDRRIAKTHVGPFVVSTVFLGVDHNFFGGGPPILFETMVFAADPNGRVTNFSELDCRRYATRAEALLGHKELVEIARCRVKTVEQLTTA